MKYCSKCGKEIMDQAVICVHCGCQIDDVVLKNNQTQTQTVSQVNPNDETSGIANCAMWFAILMPIVGFILGIVGVCKYKTPNLKNLSTVAIFVSIFFWILYAVCISICL